MASKEQAKCAQAALANVLCTQGRTVKLAVIKRDEWTIVVYSKNWRDKVDIAPTFEHTIDNEKVCVPVEVILDPSALRTKREAFED